MTASIRFGSMPTDFRGLPEYRAKETAAILARFDYETRAKAIYDAMVTRAARDYERARDRAWEECKGAWMAEGLPVRIGAGA